MMNMLSISSILCTIVSVECALNTASKDDSVAAPDGWKALIRAQEKRLESIEKRIEDVEKKSKYNIKQIARQMIMQQLYMEERTRSGGDSGVKQTRGTVGGTRPYYSNTYTSHSGVAAIHDHVQYDRSMGMGEITAVLNGVEFRTRHNDYKLMMPSTTNKDYNAVEEIPFPPVPQTVMQKRTVQEQIAEMREYFRAFLEQNTKIRDWKPYFKPVMCYLQGGWTTNTKTMEEPFHSGRHHLEASTWFELQENIRFTSFTGEENLAFLPTSIVNFTDDGSPIFAQWNYRDKYCRRQYDTISRWLPECEGNDDIKQF